MTCGSNTRKTDPAHPDRSIIAEACRVIASGGVVAFPTATLYGLAADAFNSSAVEKVRRLKHRPRDNPLLLLVPERSDVIAMVKRISPEARRIMDRFWPGLVTLVLEANEELPAHLISARRTIGLRVPAHPVARALTAAWKGPLTGTSANLSGRPGISRACEINRSLPTPPDLILDAGVLPGGIGSTVVDVTVSPPRVLREGTVSTEEILKTAGRM